MPGLKIAVLVPDGAADLSLDVLGGKTPLAAAHIPNMDRIARDGIIGTAATVPPGIPPGSDVANLSLMGYDPTANYSGRAPIEAANLGIDIPKGWTAFRCNLVKTDGERMLDYSCGHISQAASERAIEALKALNDEETCFYQGKSYRNIMLVKGDYGSVECTPPHDITEAPLALHMPRGARAWRVIELMEKSRDVLAQLRDISADMIWLWGQGGKTALESFEALYGVTGAVISAVDIVCGIGRLAGLTIIDVEGATGFLDTDYAAKGRAAIDALERGDFVFTHVEAPDEASHLGDAHEKVKALESFDESVVAPVLEHLASRGAPYRLMVAPDHPTLIKTRTHDSSPVPFAICGAGISASGAPGFNEAEAAKRGPRFEQGWRLMGKLLDPSPW
ncbi:MAG: cofactor-independent phosphoglycerate mutase [Candidatus Anoxymicrobium japonicum]|uniref:Cofactor-independent phosphoglycerate mutase n=1 Tax=Candidatus Anoxymicrobium japonicum TaxID=2013648 RepID=A0A2N3G567_9ACTN|nr:MAG: cofactor-independent phosphoglycerate mutase [Candidatus Anoxymicrobium japonicum]